jgi:hypothetical protein
MATGIVRGQAPGFLRVVSNTEHAQQEQARAAQQPTEVLGRLASHLRTQWTTAYNGKSAIETRMRKSLRQRRGEYEPDKMVEIRKTGGSEIFMMLTPAKCRAASSWLRDAILGQGSEKPWTLSPTPVADLPSDAEESLMRAVGMEVGQMIAAGMQPPEDAVNERIEAARTALMSRLREQARVKCQATETRLEDALLEGGFLSALDAAIDDLVAFPGAVIKGPVPMRQPALAWVKGPEGQWRAEVQEKMIKVFTRVDPFNFYPMPWMTSVEEGDIFELHELTPSSLYAMIGSPGYNDEEIRAVLSKCKNGTIYTDWATNFQHGARAINTPMAMFSSDRPIQALEFWGQVSGELLIDWGMDPSQVPDPQRVYNVNAWQIGPHVIKAVINIDPLGAKPYDVIPYERVPGCLWGNGVPDLIRDLQDMCNAAARSLVNNMAMSSGPMVWVNVDRMPPGEKLTSMHPWKLFQGTTDPMGSTAAPIQFFQPSSQSAELMRVYEFFSALADEYSGIPRYMVGDGNVGGAGRTSSGLSMLMGNATKLMKQVLGNIDRALEHTLTRLHTFMLRYEPNEDLEGDVRIVPRGVNSVMARETQQLRRNEFLGMTANPIDMQIMGPNGRAYLLREQAKTLGMDTDKIVPEAHMAQMAQMAQGQPPGMPMGGQPGQAAVGAMPGQPGMEGMGAPADMGQRPPGAFMDRMSA